MTVAPSLPQSNPVSVAANDARRQESYFADGALARQLLDALPGVLLVLNGQRRIVYANRALLDLCGLADVANCIGRRIGDLLDCEHAGQAPDGCGCAEPCEACGAVLAALSGLAGVGTIRECRLTRLRDERLEALDLRAEATPLQHQGENFVVMALTDISHEKRRQILENIFFHDVLNLMGSVRGFTELLQSYDLERRPEIYRLLHEAADQVIDEIEGQRLLVAAERGALRLAAEPFEGLELLQALAELYRAHPVCVERCIEVLFAGERVSLVSDRTLVFRILGNMLKNALEACAEGETVTLGCRVEGPWAEFFVHNPGGIPPRIQRQIFKRNFSTKGDDRGLGTYGMRLLSNYLRGEVHFTSAAETGTRFFLRLPLKLAGTQEGGGRR
ncbi:PAS domain-containing sensor histidine kinase [Desulfuromonas acetexigens]|uniref:histidine kinase n=1 Tax=Trichloromonas acetexigens TaxID=38815 RepID=A0A550JFG5_9BACT|nr:PAS domain-containing sensor histidine kinase [Desulfuromonas acetexigens]TRO81951.1 PAS domain-containing protein [Desulfuromonas acetexigens]